MMAYCLTCRVIIDEPTKAAMLAHPVERCRVSYLPISFPVEEDGNPENPKGKK